jgi:hypothetical protein
MPAHKGGRHYERLSEVQKVAGIFVYNGSGVAVEYHPTPLKTGKKEPVFDTSGNPVVDKDGNQVFETPGKIKLGPDNKPILGGPPKEVRVKLDPFVVQGTEFHKGKQVRVDNQDLARKLRCMPTLFDEVEGKGASKQGDK